MILPTDFVLFTDAILENGAQRVLGKTLQVWSSGFPLSNKMASKKSLILVAVFRGKYLLENAGNDISKPLDFKIFWGGMPPDPPRGSHLQRSLSQPPIISKQPSTFKKT